MAYTSDDLKAQLVDYVNTNPGWNWLQWNDETYWLGLHHKFDDQLTALQAMYTAKLKRIYQNYKEIFDILRYGVSESFIAATSEDDIIDLKAIKTKVMRIARKWRGVNAEIAGRAAGFFGPGLTYDRVYHGTEYYIDLDNGNDGNTGLNATGQEWLTLDKYTTGTVRSVGDIAYVRANTTQTFAADLIFDEDGDEDDYIHIIGCDSVVNDPWSDSSDVKPIIDFNSTASYVWLSGDDYWKLERLVIKNSTDIYGPFYNSASFGTYLESCEMRDSAGTGINCREGGVYAKDCTIIDVAAAGVGCTRGGLIVLEGCNIDRVAGAMARGLRAENMGRIVAIDCTIGATNSPTTDDIRVEFNCAVFLRNTTYDDTNLLILEHGYLYSEDDNGVLGAHVSHQGAGTTERETTIVRSGGSASSIEMTSNENCGANLPLRASGFWHDLQHWPDAAWKIWCADALTTITVYIRAKGTWGAYPVASELYIEASYISDAGAGGDRTKVASNDVLSHPTDWKAFDVTFTPLRAGFVYLNVFLKKYEDAGDGCYVDIAPEIT